MLCCACTSGLAVSDHSVMTGEVSSGTATMHTWLLELLEVDLMAGVRESGEQVGRTLLLLLLSGVLGWHIVTKAIHYMLFAAVKLQKHYC